MQKPGHEMKKQLRKSLDDLFDTSITLDGPELLSNGLYVKKDSLKSLDPPLTQERLNQDMLVRTGVKEMLSIRCLKTKVIFKYLTY